MRVAAGAALGTGPGTPIQGTSVTPRPSSATDSAGSDAAVRRAKVVALVLFGALVVVHARKAD